MSNELLEQAVSDDLSNSTISHETKTITYKTDSITGSKKGVSLRNLLLNSKTANKVQNFSSSETQYCTK